MSPRRVVITGTGVISPVGLDTATFWQSLLGGRSGVGPITFFDPSEHATQIAAEIPDFDPLNYMDRKEARRNDRFVQLALAASQEATRQAGLSSAQIPAERMGVIIGSGIGGFSTIFEQIQVLLEKGPSRVSPFTVPMMISDMAAGMISITYGAKGINYCTTSACASSAHAIGESFESIRRGIVDVMITGGSEASVVPMSIAAFNAARTLSCRNDEPERASRPFDAERDGFILGEGGAILVLEALESAQERGIPILAEMVGYGATADANHITAPAPGGAGAVQAMRLALAQAGLRPEDVDYLNAHGTSTLLNDIAETQAIKAVFGRHAPNLPISSTKSMVGHLLGAAGAMESIVCIETIRHGVIHPTTNYEHPDPECDLDYVPNQPRQADVRVALSNSLGFGGHNVSLIFSRYEE
ncbi:MAG: beta-ketoacyl-ACP synthase II [Chloroflexia bacterium]|nr:beta-ketoacyl-ACP synthase II [Chloroflexia bacterium]